MLRCHKAAEGFDITGATWNTDMADPTGGPIICHNDVCLENVVFRHGEAVALVDFDFAAPGHPLYDLASMARMNVPVDDPESAAVVGWEPADQPARLRVVADAARLDRTEREQLLAALDSAVAASGEFVRRRVEAGDPGFVARWEATGGQERFDRRRRWWVEARPSYHRALR